MTDQQSSGEKRSGDVDTQGRSSTKQKKLVKVWTDGCFDMMHYGHANALRQVSRGEKTLFSRMYKTVKNVEQLCSYFRQKLWVIT